MTYNHTQGPWKLKNTNMGKSIEMSGKSFSIIPSMSLSKEEHEANTLLIAAAPNMLQALEVALYELEVYDSSAKGQDKDTANALAAVRLAIEKATGENLER